MDVSTRRASAVLCAANLRCFVNDPNGSAKNGFIPTIFWSSMNSKVNKYSVGDLSGQKILVIDDVPFNRLLPGLILRPFGAEVFECADVHQACELLEQHWVQLILLDISMPGIDGLESLTVLKAHPASDRTQFKICAYTAYGAGEKEAELLAMGFDGILHKPVKNQKLIELAMK